MALVVCNKMGTPISCISGLVAEYMVAIDVTRARFPADALCAAFSGVEKDPAQSTPCGCNFGFGAQADELGEATGDDQDDTAKARRN